MKLRVLTWNVLYANRAARTRALCEVIERIAPDVVMLQETSPDHAAEIAAHLNLQVAAVPDVASTDATSVPALLARVPLADTAVIELSSANDGHRYWAANGTWTEAALSVQLASTHLRHTHLAGRMGLDDGYRRAGRLRETGRVEPMVGDPSIADSVALRLDQSRALADHLNRTAIEGSARILGGDFNFVPDGPEYHSLLNRGWRDAWRSAPRLGSGSTILDRNPLIADNPAPYAERCATEHPGGSENPDYTLDFQFVYGSAQVNEAWTVGDPGPAGGDWPSDHLGIVVNYDL